MYIFVDDSRLLLETGDALLTETSNTLVLELSDPEGMITIESLNPTLAVPYYHQQLFQSLLMVDPSAFQPVFYEVWQNQPATLMPTVPLREHSPDVAQMSSFHLQLSDPTHFGPDGTGEVQGPVTFDILEGSSDFEIRTPE